MFALVALSSFIHDLIPYRLKDLSLKPGQRVLVPFGKKTKIGLVMDIVNNTTVDPNHIKDIHQTIDEKPLVPKHWIDLCAKISQYYHVSVHLVSLQLIPPAMKKEMTFTPLPYWLKKNPRYAIHKHTPSQKKLLNELNSNTISKYDLKSKGFTKNTLLKLIEKESLLLSKPIVIPHQKPNLSQKQQTIANALKWNKFSTTLLYGITGSGKTEIYAHWILECINKGLKALVLIPEIGLTPQTLSRFQHLNVPVACLHSKMSEQERQEQWYDISNNDVQLVIGTRSAIFSPIDRLGLIIIDEEHDTSFKQQNQWRYHAREVAGFLAHTLSIPLVLGSATPSLETLHNTQIQKFNLQTLEERHQNLPLPDIITVDCKQHPLNNGFTLKTLEKMQHHINQKHQIMVYLNRRGYSPVSVCKTCGKPAKCSVCDKNFTYHKQTNSFQCHHCQIFLEKIPCRSCPESLWVHVGHGTENIHEFLENHFQCKVIRLDRDTSGSYESFSNLLEQAQNNEAPIIVGTQMLSKGHNFPNLQLVVILNVDQYLFSQDFRANETLAQQVIQVAGRCGRFQPGQVILQTFQNQHPMIVSLQKQHFLTTANMLLEDRKNFNLPPYASYAILRASHTSEKIVKSSLQSFLNQLPSHLKVHTSSMQPSQYIKKKGHFNYYVIVFHDNKSSLNTLLTCIQPHIQKFQQTFKTVSFYLEMDPIEF